jgi:hypothetical protein
VRKNKAGLTAADAVKKLGSRHITRVRLGSVVNNNNNNYRFCFGDHMLQMSPTGHALWKASLYTYWRLDHALHRVGLFDLR